MYLAKFALAQSCIHVLHEPEGRFVEQVMNSPSKLQKATHWLQDNLTFDIDERVHVFEVTIRVLGKCGTGCAAFHQGDC